MNLDPTLAAALVGGAVAILVTLIPSIFGKRKTDTDTMETLQNMLNKAMSDIEALQKRLDERENPIRVVVEIETVEPRIMGARVSRLPRIADVESLPQT